MVDGMPVKVYVNHGNNTAVVFPPFGRIYRLWHDVSVLDFATTFVVAKFNNVVTFESYLSSGEDTAVTNLNRLTG